MEKTKKNFRKIKKRLEAGDLSLEA